VPRGVVAVLNANWSGSRIHRDGRLRINWLTERSLFDFDWIEIVQASDEEVERFAVQLGNDTDPVRRRRYRHLHCFIGQSCRLSENTLRILQRMVGPVKQLQGQAVPSTRGRRLAAANAVDSPVSDANRLPLKNSETTV